MQPSNSSQLNAFAVNDAAQAEFDDEVAGAMASVREIPAWLISLVVHAVILVVLGSLTQVRFLDKDREPISSVIEDLQQEQYKLDPTVVDQIGTDGQFDTYAPTQSLATQVGPERQADIQQQLEEEILEPDFQVANVVMEPSQDDLAAVVNIQGQTEVPEGGVAGSIDRMTFEIAAALKERKTLAVWLFDESGSMEERRNAIADRFENVYEQLGLLNVGADKALKTAVVGFSDKTVFYTPQPVDDFRVAVEKVRNIKPAKSPKEMVFTAVEQSIEKWLGFRTRQRRNMMIIIVTDERGDDYQKVEDVAAKAAKYGIRCYCIGNASVFGREKGYVPYVYPDGYRIMAAVDQGPETVRPERLGLPFFGINGADLRQVTAGYGPYALTRLCAETKGMYLVADQGGRQRFDPSVMRNYRPDYRPIRVYDRDVQRNPTKMWLVKAARNTNDPNNQPRPPQTVFRADSDNTLRVEVTEAQKPLAVFDGRLIELQTMLAQGEKDRPKLKEPRWRAAYDLAMGRVLALRVRVYGYNVVLAQMKSSPKTFQDPQNNVWQLAPSKEITAGAAVKKMAKKATEYLTRVIDEHPGTPWMALAERELSQPMGWEWKESRRNFAATGNGNRPDPNNMILFERDPKTGKKKKVGVKKRQPPAL